ncbi:hypothetical protein F0562_007301 [Nyssa sinensis]|uniref:Uncharacterized protein n=1 Tax=Nyssa sinensis TaxID=561372 RepID=A0A5J5A6F6_9ASTE|nr:hypothetical protein F0562_007301 [Nyssa sinensis]
MEVGTAPNGVPSFYATGVVVDGVAMGFGISRGGEAVGEPQIRGGFDAAELCVCCCSFVGGYGDDLIESERGDRFYLHLFLFRFGCCDELELLKLGFCGDGGETEAQWLIDLNGSCCCKACSGSRGLTLVMNRSSRGSQKEAALAATIGVATILGGFEAIPYQLGQT